MGNHVITSCKNAHATTSHTTHQHSQELRMCPSVIEVTLSSSFLFVCTHACIYTVAA